MTSDRDLAVLSAVAAGERCKPIARRFGLSPSHVYTMARKNGLRFCKGRYGQIIAALEAGHVTAQAIAKQISAPVPSVRTILSILRRKGSVEKNGFALTITGRKAVVWKIRESGE